MVARLRFKILALMAQKGGAGKTTLAVHFATIAQASGLRTLLIDCDPQRSAAHWGKTRASASVAMVEAPPERLGAIAGVAQSNGVELIVVDTRASVERDAGQIAWLADFCLIPARPSVLDLAAVGATVSLVRAAGRRGAIILNGCPPGNWLGEASATTAARRRLTAYGLPISPIAINNRVAFVHPLTKGLTAVESDPTSKAAIEMQRAWDWTKEQLWEDEHG
jgi:chromosome partitioning protein